MKVCRYMFPLLVLFVMALPVNSYAVTFFDDFNDGNADGWIFPYNYDQTQGGVVDWSVEDGILVQHLGSDSNTGLVDNLMVAGQTIEARMHTVGYAGVVIWYQQVDAEWANYVAIDHNYQTGMHVIEMIDGQGYLSPPYGGPWISGDTWYDLRVEADSRTGNLKVYVNGVYLFTHVVSTQYRTGLSGVYSGNAHGYFDNFTLTSDADSDGVPDGEDQCPNSILTSTVCIGDCDSGVLNTLFASGCTISDNLDVCSDEATNRKQYVSCVNDYLDSLKQAGVITNKQKGAIQKCK
jgi:hypothetical protein